jgi:hypothetical protein
MQNWYRMSLSAQGTYDAQDVAGQGTTTQGVAGCINAAQDARTHCCSKASLVSARLLHQDVGL